VKQPAREPLPRMDKTGDVKSRNPARLSLFSYGSLTFWAAAVFLAVLSGVAFHLAPQLPYGIPFDEPIKVFFVREGGENFQHPILMLQVVRFANLFLDASDNENVLVIGRGAAAFSGGLMVFSAILLARRAVSEIAAFGAGFLTAVAPLTVVHAQLFKEDVFVAPWLLLGVLALDPLVARPDWRRAILFGIVMGLAASTKFSVRSFSPWLCCSHFGPARTFADIIRWLWPPAWWPCSSSVP
jgi:hypothetical protein